MVHITVAPHTSVDFYDFFHVLFCVLDGPLIVLAVLFTGLTGIKPSVDLRVEGVHGDLLASDQFQYVTVWIALADIAVEREDSETTFRRKEQEDVATHDQVLEGLEDRRTESATFDLRLNGAFDLRQTLVNDRAFLRIGADLVHRELIHDKTEER
jgi:hypothetical protein